MPFASATGITFGNGSDPGTSTEIGTIILTTVPGKEVEVHPAVGSATKWATGSVPALKAAVDEAIARYDASATGIRIDVGDSDPGENDDNVAYQESGPFIQLVTAAEGSGQFQIDTARGLSLALDLV